jgi:hypothetical protein
MLSRPDSVMQLSPAILQSRSSDEPLADFGLHCSVQQNKLSDTFQGLIPSEVIIRHGLSGITSIEACCILSLLLGLFAPIPIGGWVLKA